MPKPKRPNAARGQNRAGEASTTQTGAAKRPRTRSRAGGAGKPDPAAFTPEFRERLDEASRRAFGAPIEEIVPPGEERDLLYQVFTKVLSHKPRPISPETMDLVERCRAAGLVVTPGAGGRYLRKPLTIKGLEGRSVLTDAILEARYGSDS